MQQCSKNIAFSPMHVTIFTYQPPFTKNLLQGHILEIPDTNAPTGLSTLLTPPLLAGPSNTQQRTAFCDAGSGTTCHGKIPSIQGQIQGSPLTMGSRGREKPGDPAHQE